MLELFLIVSLASAVGSVIGGFIVLSYKDYGRKNKRNL